MRTSGLPRNCRYFGFSGWILTASWASAPEEAANAMVSRAAQGLMRLPIQRCCTPEYYRFSVLGSDVGYCVQRGGGERNDAPEVQLRGIVLLKEGRSSSGCHYRLPQAGRGDGPGRRGGYALR